MQYIYTAALFYQTVLSLRKVLFYIFYFIFFAINYKLMKKANNEQNIKVEQLTYITCRRPASSLVWQPSEGDKNELINVTKK